MKKYLALFAIVVGLAACAQPISGVITSDEQRIWVVRGQDEVYRCGDGAGADAPPRPLCVRAPMTQAQ